MTKHTRPRRVHAVAILTALLAALLLSTGCAARGEVPPEEPIPLSRESAADYSYLVFLDGYRTGNTKAALEALNTALTLHPTPSLYGEGAEYLWSIGNLKAAGTMLRRGIEAYPGDRLLTMRLADLYMIQRRYDDAELVLNDFLLRFPGDATALLKKAELYIDTDRNAEALDTLKLIGKENESSASLYLEAMAKANLGDRRNAIEILKKAVARYPENILAWSELAYLYELEKDYVNAEKAYTQILELGENRQEVWLRLISVNLKLNNPDKAMDLALVGPQDTRFTLEAARVFLNEGFPEGAVEILRPLSESDAPPAEMWFYLALASYDQDRDPAKALAYLDRIPEDHSFFPRTLSYRAHLLYLLGRTDETLEAIRRGKELYPDVRDFVEVEAWVLEDKGELDPAMQLLEEALAKWSDDMGLRYRLGVIQEKAGQRDKALGTMETIIRQDPEHADALNFVGYVLADEGRDLDRAIVLIKTALKLKPDSGYIIDSLAWAYFRMGNLDKAWEEISRAVKLTDNDPTVWEHYGDIATALGKKTQARKAYQRALDLSPEAPDSLRTKLKKL